MIEHVLRSGDALRPASTTVVVGHEADLVCETSWRRGLRFPSSFREPQLGTGHALLQAERPLAGRRGTLVVLSGDAPLLRPGTLERLVDTHTAKGAAATVLTASVADPTGYGRIVGRMAPSCRSSSIETRARRSAGSAKSTAASTLSISSRCSRRYAPSAPRTRRGVLPAGPRPPVSQARARGRDGGSRAIPPRFSASTAAVSWRSSRRTSAIARTKSSWPRASPSSIPRERGSNRTFPWGRTAFCHPGVYLQGRTTIGARCELHVQRAYRGQRARGRRVREHSFCVIAESRVRSARANRSVRAPPPAVGRGESARVGNFVELKRPFWDADRKPIISPIWAMRRSARRSTSVPARSRATTMASRRTRRSSRTERFIGSDSQLGGARANRPRRIRRGGIIDHPRTCRPVRSGSRVGCRSTKRAGSSVARQEGVIDPTPSAERRTESDTMCGIIGYIGPQASPADSDRRPAAGSSIAGYDSAGVAVVRNGAIELRRSARQAVEPRGRHRRAIRSRATTASAIRAGRRTVGPPRRTPIPIVTVPGASLSSTTGSSRTTST